MSDYRIQITLTPQDVTATTADGSTLTLSLAAGTELLAVLRRHLDPVAFGDEPSEDEAFRFDSNSSGFDKGRLS